MVSNYIKYFNRTIRYLNSDLLVALFIITFASFLSFSTWFILTGQSSITPSNNMIIFLFVANIIFVMLIFSLIIVKITRILINAKRKIPGSNLQLKLIGLFGVVAAIPAIIVIILATITLDRGLDAWFSEKTYAIINNSNIVAQSYLNEHSNNVRSEISAMQFDLNRSYKYFINDIDSFGKYFIRQARLRELSGAYIVDSMGRVQIRTNTPSFEIGYSIPSDDSFDLADRGTTVVFKPNNYNMVSALILLPDFVDSYLLIYRAVDPLVIKHLEQLNSSKNDYDDLIKRRSDVQYTFALQYIGLSLVFLSVVIWFSIFFANRLANPISQLIRAAKSASEGNFDTTISHTNTNDDISNLVYTFNTMINELKNQREKLILNNTMIDERRKFTEAVLSGVTSGVIGVDTNGNIQIANSFACDFLEKDLSELIGKSLIDVSPEFSDFLINAFKNSFNVDQNIKIKKNGFERNLHIKTTKEEKDILKSAIVITFDDVTDLVEAQRSSVWADVARRIAHEIKNPLTPILLSAERLQRKYTPEIISDIDVFEECVGTIIRQVGDIGQMVDEFASFAKMPSTIIEKNDICDVIKQNIIMYKVSNQNIEFISNLPDTQTLLNFDRRLISQSIINLIKNSAEAIAVKHKNNQTGIIQIEMKDENKFIHIIITDNGCGLPIDDINKLTEPYFTTREKGTGLGLAVVKKITEDHNGKLFMENIINEQNEVLGARTLFTISKQLSLNNNAVVTK
jgi:two-component system nitrogen regulation sensor histidine kinase NtrY